MTAKEVAAAVLFDQVVKDHDTFLFDCDGVLWHGNTPVQGAADVVKHLESHGKTIVYVTNNNGKTRKEYFQKFQSLGFPAEEERVFCTSYTSAQYIKRLHKDKGKVYVVGNEGMSKELDNVGIENFGVGPDNEVTSINVPQIKKMLFDDNVEAVLVGFDGNISFSKILKAATYLNNEKCRFIATNEDLRYPTDNPDIVVPGSGVVINAVASAAQRDPDMMCGKPGNFMFQCIKESGIHINPKRTIMIGDRMNTDILFGKRNGCRTLLVLSGIETRSSLTKAENSSNPKDKEYVPDYFINSLTEWSLNLRHHF